MTTDGSVASRVAHAESLIRFGRVAEGIESLQQVAQQHPEDRRIQYKLLWNLHYVPGYDRAFFHDRYTRLGLDQAPSMPPERHFSGPFDPSRRIRVGWVSSNFLDNAPGDWYLPAIELCDHRQFEIFGYGNVKDPDQTTARIRAMFDAYRDIHDRSDNEVVGQICRDRIDILVEIGGFSRGHRMGVFMQCPAPIQADLGGISTMGLPQVGYRITDDLWDPPETQQSYTEKLVYLPCGALTYRPPPASPAVGPLPALHHGYVTFGSFNNLRKINDLVLSMWVRILKQIPDARMVLKFPAANDPEVCEYLRLRFEGQGIDSARICMCGTTSFFDHLALLEQVDLLLDCFPFNGARTTLEGFWMGVPTVTLVGDTWVSRVGGALLTRLGLEQFIARTPDQYVSRACQMAGQWKELAAIREGLRERLLTGPLCDPNRFTRELEAAFRGMWVSWCQSQIQNPESKIQNGGSIGQSSIVNHQFQEGIA